MKNKETDRRAFIKTSAGATMGALVLPGTAMFMESCTSGSQNRNSSALKCNINWVEMMRDHDLIWKKVPSEMKEAPHFGNGLIGSMIWVEENSIRLQVFRADVHDHGDHTYGWAAYSNPRYQIGYFTIETKGKITDCKLRQNIYNADLKGIINTDQGSFKIDHFVHRHDDVIYTEIRTTGDEVLSEWQWHPFEAKTSRGGSAEGYGKAYSPYKKINNPEHRIEKNKEISTGIQDLTCGGNYATAWKDDRSEKNSSKLLITIQNSYPEKTSSDDAIAVINNAQEKMDIEFLEWRNRHQKWWHNYYPESFVTFPDSVGQTFYWTNVYRLACCTRPDAQYIDTPGMWSSGGPWPYSTHDFNTQTVHFPVYTANRLHLGEALVESIQRNRQNLIDNVVPEEWQEDSALLPLATAFDMKGKRDGDKRYSEMVGCLPWLLNNVWLHYRYTMDKEMLRVKLFPILKRSINFYRHLLFKGDDGKLHLPPTYSPEMENTSDCNMDLSLLKWGCLKLIEICEILDIHDPLIPEWKLIVDNLVDFPVDEFGYMMGKDKSGPYDHRHMSHLMMIYPLYLENIDNAADINLLEKSVKNYEPKWAVKMGASHSSPVAAALGFGNLAYKRMNLILYHNKESEALGPNGIYYLATPCIETSLSYNTCVQDMLLQSWGNKIRVFPALPDVWQDVSFHNLRTEGAFLVSAKREKGKTCFVRIKSLAGEPCIVNPSMNETMSISDNRNHKLKELENGFYEINLKKGEEVILYQENDKPEINIEPIAMEENTINYFGLNN